MKLRVVDACYTTESEGYKDVHPIVHLFGRDPQWQRHHVRVDAFRPYFCVPEREWRRLGEDVAADDRVLRVETEDRQGRPEVSLAGERLYRVVCREPEDVGDLRELFEDPHEADVLFPTRFLVDLEAFQWIQVPEDADERTVSVEELDSVEEPPAQTPPLRVCTYDIEVQQGGSGPPVVSTEGTERADNPITAITAHDNYTDEYHVWVTAHGDWDRGDYEAAREAVNSTVEVYQNPRDVPAQFCQWVCQREFDALTGWNAAGFDHPYLVNYCLNNGINGVYDLSPTGTVYPMDGDGQFINSSLSGRLLLDSMTLYEKTTIHELDSKRLADVAAAEAEDVSVGKLDLEAELDVPRDEPAIDYAWREQPDLFVQYALRDTKSAVGINRESKESVNIL